MCLSTIIAKHDGQSEEIHEVWKFLKREYLDAYSTAYIGRHLEVDRWHEADKITLETDGGGYRPYTSGFHCYVRESEALASGWENNPTLTLVKVQCKGLLVEGEEFDAKVNVYRWMRIPPQE